MALVSECHRLDLVGNVLFESIFEINLASLGTKNGTLVLKRFVRSVIRDSILIKIINVKHCQEVVWLQT